MILTTGEGLGEELTNLMREHLRIPPTVLKFSVHFAPPNITVDCTYHPEAPEQQPAPVPADDAVARHMARKL